MSFPGAIPGFNEPFPVRDAIVKENRRPADVLVRYEEQSLLLQVQAAPRRTQPAAQISLSSSSESGRLGGDQIAGLYRVSWAAYVRTLEAASTVTLAVLWTYGGIVRTQTFTALNGAAVANQQGGVHPIQIDAGTPILYTLTYVGATLVYDATISAELVEAMG